MAIGKKTKKAGVLASIALTLGLFSGYAKADDSDLPTTPPPQYASAALSDAASDTRIFSKQSLDAYVAATWNSGPVRGTEMSAVLDKKEKKTMDKLFFIVAGLTYASVVADVELTYRNISACDRHFSELYAGNPNVSWSCTEEAGWQKAAAAKGRPTFYALHGGIATGTLGLAYLFKKLDFPLWFGFPGVLTGVHLQGAVNNYNQARDKSWSVVEVHVQLSF